MLADTLVAVLTLWQIRAQELSLIERPTLPLARYIAPAFHAPRKKEGEGFGVLTTGKSAILLDGASGAVLFERTSKQPYSIASLTKIMTAMTVLDKKQPLDEELEYTKEDLPSEGKSVIALGDRLTRKEWLSILLIGSVNEAGNVLARNYPGGKEAFVEAMNQKAKDLELVRAVFVEPTGLDAKNKASAEDVARMLRQALQYNEIREITEQPKIEVRGKKLDRSYLIKSTNLLLDSFLNKEPYHIVAAKTGSLPEAGYCLAQAVRNKDGHELIAVTLGSENHFSRYQDVKALLGWGFDAYTWDEKDANK